MNDQEDDRSQVLSLPLSRLNRRSALAVVGAVGVTGIFATASGASQSNATPVPSGGAATAVSEALNLGDTGMPDWRFSVTVMQDPYAGTLTKPVGVPQKTRVIALEVILTNHSDHRFSSASPTFDCEIQMGPSIGLGTTWAPSQGL